MTATRMSDNKLIEKISEKVHEAWIKEKEKQGFSAPIKACSRCGVDSMSLIEHDHQRCRMCNYEQKTHKDMIPHEELAENIKNINRSTVRAVLQAMDDMGIKISTKKGGDGNV